MPPTWPLLSTGLKTSFIHSHMKQSLFPKETDKKRDYKVKASMIIKLCSYRDEPCSVKRGINASAKRFGSGQPARDAQADLSRICLLSIFFLHAKKTVVLGIKMLVIQVFFLWNLWKKMPLWVEYGESYVVFCAKPKEVDPIKILSLR